MMTDRSKVRPESNGTVFEDDQSKPTNYHQAVTVPYETVYEIPRQTKRQRTSQPASDPRAQMYALEKAKAAAARKVHIPSVPVYDNGNPTPIARRRAFDEAVGIVPGSSEVTTTFVPPMLAGASQTSLQAEPVQPSFPYESNYASQESLRAAPVRRPLAQIPAPVQQSFLYQSNYASQEALKQPSAQTRPPQASQPLAQSYPYESNYMPREPTQPRPQPNGPRKPIQRQFATLPPNTYHSQQGNSARKGSLDSTRSSITQFETDEDTTPESELDKQLKLKPTLLSPVMESPARQMAQGRFVQQTSPTSRPRNGNGYLASPIKDLTYPRIPRPAAVARQADRPPRQTRQHVRDRLVRKEASFLQSESTSSGAGSARPRTPTRQVQHPKVPDYYEDVQEKGRSLGMMPTRRRGKEGDLYLTVQ